MALVTDLLETIFKGPDLKDFQQSLGVIGDAFKVVAETEGLAAAATAAFDLSLTALKANIIPLTGALIAAVGVLAGAHKAFETFTEDQEAVFRASVVLRNLGLTPMIDRLRAFGSELQKTIAIDDEAIVAVGGLLASFGVAQSQIEPAIRAVADASIALGKPIEETARLFARGLLPNGSRALRELRVQFQATGDKVRDTATLIQKLNGLFGGAGEAERNTPRGRLNALAEAAANVFSEFGRILSAAFAPGIELAIKFLTALADKLADLNQQLERAGLIPPLNTGQGIGAPGARAALQGDEMLDELRGIRHNTQATADAIIRQAFGGPGTIGRQAGTVRALNAALRATR